MRLMSAVLGFVLRKLGLFLALLTLFGLLFLLSEAFKTTRDAVADQKRLPQVTADKMLLEEQLKELKSTAAEAQRQADEAVKAKRADLKDARNRKKDLCSFRKRFVDAVTPGSGCEAAQKAVKELDEALTTLERGPDGARDAVLERQIDNKKKELDKRRPKRSD